MITDRLTNQSRTIFDTIQNATKSMANGDSITLDALAQQVAEELNMKTTEALPFVRYFAHQTEQDNLGFVRNGKNGGWVKGAKPNETKKTSKKSSKATIIEV